MKKCRIFVVDDHSVVREGFISLISENETYYVSGEAPNGEEALTKIHAMEFKPEVVLMDVNMPVMDGIVCSKQLLETYPDMRIVALTMVTQIGHIRQMLEIGVKGYILKSGSRQELYDAIDAVMRGEQFFSSEVGQIVMRDLVSPKEKAQGQAVHLSVREQEVLEHVVQDETNKHIAKALGISVRTVETHKQNLLAKVGVNSVAGLVVYALKNGLVDNAKFQEGTD